MGKHEIAFDVANALTKKEKNKIRKFECMIQFYLARMPMYGAHESEQYKNAQNLKSSIATINAKARARWELGHV